MTIPPGTPGPAGPPGPQDRSPESDVTASAATCFRHPGRETYVSCVRCGRPACPDCLRSAAVGQQCVECIREGSRGTRRATAPFGGNVANRPLATWTLVALNVLAYIGELVNSNALIDNGAMVGRLNATIGVADGQWYRLLTNALLRQTPGRGFGIFHIECTMWALTSARPVLQRLLGSSRCVAVS